MSLHLYNTMTGNKEAFTPIQEGKVGIYVCGPTVYDMSHIGHARAYVAFDTVVRYLRRSYEVTYVRNFTDVDDKIIKRAAERGEDPSVVSEQFIEEFKTDMSSLGVAPADIEPKVTEHMDEIIEMVGTLINKDFAYTSGSDVYYSVSKFNDYNKLSGRKIEESESGTRVVLDEAKRDPADFALWKAVKPGEPEWKTEWGSGRPGWHIECSAMSSKYLGATFDIHGGGKDLIFPHHENEIAQSEAAHGEKFAKYWLHNGFVNIDNEKMSKSLNNFFTIREVIKKFDAQALRYFLLTTHYRSPINFSDKSLSEAENRVKYIYETLARLSDALSVGESQGTYREEFVAKIVTDFEKTMDDDFNTAKAVGDLSKVFGLINEILDKPGDAEADARTLRAIKSSLDDVGSTLGLFVEDPHLVLERMAERKESESGVDSAKVDALIVERAEARKTRDFSRSDAIRDELTAMGVVIKDSAAGTTWELA